MKRKDLDKKLPDSPGVYFFKKGKSILYIGKATSLKDRVTSYFSTDLLESRGPKITKMLEEANRVTWQETDSVLEALILESQLIKEHQPIYNSKEKDNKSYNYVVITNEDFPRVFTMRGRELEGQEFVFPAQAGIQGRNSPQKNSPRSRAKSGKTDGLKPKAQSLTATFGPFPHGNQLREALKIIRKIFPFLDKSSKQKTHQRFYQQLSLSPDLTESAAKKKYKKTIKNIQLFFEGKKERILKSLEREMKKLAKEQKFEEANEVKKQIFALRHIRDVSLIKETKNYQLTTNNFRIEAYDIAHTQGAETVGVMTVVESGEIEKNEYRKFNVKSDKKGSDTHALEEVLERRLNHDEWQLPRLVVIDGGLAQLRVGERVLKKFGYQIPVVSVVKDERHRPKMIKGDRKLIQKYEKEILLANAEAHRFAIGFHRKRLRGRQ